jgi:hypothetical protein
MAACTTLLENLGAITSLKSEKLWPAQGSQHKSQNDECGKSVFHALIL